MDHPETWDEESLGQLPRKAAVSLGRNEYKITTDRDSAGLGRLEAMVNERISDLGPEAFEAGTPDQILAIASLRLAEDLEFMTDELNRVRSFVLRESSGAIEHINAQRELVFREKKPG